MHQGNIWKKLDSIFSSFIFIVTGLWFFLIKDGACLRINDLVVPEVVKNGTAPTVVLDCDYSLDNSEGGLVVKWFLNDGDTPVYQWIPPQRPQDLGKLKTLTSNVESFCPMPQWDSISGADLSGSSSQQQDLYDAFADDGGSRGKRSLSIYYPPMVLPPGSLSTWHQQCPVQQILTIDSSIMAKPLACKAETLPMCVQMVEIPGTVGTPICGPMTYESELIQPMMPAAGMSAACTAAEEAEPAATEAPEEPEKEEPAAEASDEASQVAGFLSKVFTPSALTELSKLDDKTEMGEVSNVKRQIIPDQPLNEVIPLPDDKKLPVLDDVKAKLLKDALADPNSAVSSLLTILKSAPPPPVAAPSGAPPGLLGLDAKVLSPKGLISLDANVLNLLGIDASILGPKGLISIDTNLPKTSPPVSAGPAKPSSDPALLDLNASVLGPKGLLDIDANVLKLLGVDLSVLGPKGLVSLDANLPESAPPAAAVAPPSPPPPPAPTANGGVLGLDASVLGPKGLVDINANVLKLLGLDVNVLGPKGVLSLDANIPKSSPAPPPPALPQSAKPGLLNLDASVLGPKGVLDVEANVLKLLGLDLNLLGPKGVLKLDARIPNTPPQPVPKEAPTVKLPLDPALQKLLLKALGPKAFLALLSKALSPGVLLALLQSSKPAGKCCPCPASVLELAPSVSVIEPDPVLDLAIIQPDAIEIPATTSTIYEIYGNDYSPIMPVCAKSCSVPVCKTVRSACSAPLRALNRIRTLGPLAKLVQDPDTTDPPPPATTLPQVPNTTDAIPEEPTTVAPHAEDAQTESSSQDSTALSQLKSLTDSGFPLSLAESLTRFMNMQDAEEPVDGSVSTTTESIPITAAPESPEVTEPVEDAAATSAGGINHQLEPDAEFIVPHPQSDLPQKMNLLSDSHPSCQQFLETISQPVLKHFTYQLELPH